MSLKGQIVSTIDKYDWVRKEYFRLLRLIFRVPHRRILRNIRDTGLCRIVFIIQSLSMWRLQELYDKLLGDPRFEPTIVLSPAQTFTKEQQDHSIRELISFFEYRGLNYIDSTSPKYSDFRFWKELDPHVVFYPQLYRTIYPRVIGINDNLDKLICYLPYGWSVVRGDWIFNNKYSNLLWKWYLPTSLHLKYVKDHSFEKGKSCVVVGYPQSELLHHEQSEVWKIQDSRKKRVIWAPHFSIREGGYLHRDSFLWLFGFMSELAEKYKDRVQFAFKPHPRLLSELYSYPGWGKEKAECYYNCWANGDNTQLVTGEFAKLFSSSDALIHDCGSFTAEYLLTKKPVLFTSHDFASLYKELNPFGEECMNHHYWAKSEADIISFMDNVVLGVNDTMQASRYKFSENVLLSNTSITVTENIYHELVDTIFV